MSDNIRFAIITTSDTRSLAQDQAGDALEQSIAKHGWTCEAHMLVKDEKADIADAICHCADDLKVDVILTCGGTGLSLRDVTPDATQEVCERNVSGIAEAMRWHSLQYTSRAMLSRALCMQRGRVLVINLPGSTKAATQNWEGIVEVLPHAVSMMAGGGHQ